MAIELSKKSWIVAVNAPLSDKVGRHTLRAGDWKGLLDLIAPIRTRVVEALNRPVEVISCYEAAMTGSGCIVCSKLMACATTSSIRRACRWIGERDE